MYKIALSAVLSGAIFLSACGSGSDEANSRGKVTQTRMDDIDSIEGTINDEMINVDETTESAALAKDDKGVADVSAQNDKAEDDKSTDSAEESDSGN